MERLAKPALSLFRRMLRLAGRLPAADRAPTVTKIRAAFRENRSETSAERCVTRRRAQPLASTVPTAHVAPLATPRSVRELLEVAQQKLGYLRVVTPRRADDDELLGVGGARRYVVHDGRVVEVDAGAGAAGDDRGRPAVKNWGAGNMDPDSVRRHEGLMRRFRFEDRVGGARGPFSQ